MATSNVPVQDLEEGMEVCCHAERDEWQIVEQVVTIDGRTRVLLIDGRSITLPAERLVTVAS